MKLKDAIRLSIRTVNEIDNQSLNPSDQILHSSLLTIIRGLGALKAQNCLSYVEWRSEYISINLDAVMDYWIATEDDRLCWCYRVLQRVAQIWVNQATEEQEWLESFDEV